jgi:hypothetical protein
MKITNKKLDELYKECLKLVKNKKSNFFVLRKMRGSVGLCYENDRLEFDYRKDIIPTAFHECFHQLYPEWSETKVKYVESRIINYLPPVKIAEFLLFFSKKIYLSECRKSLE